MSPLRLALAAAVLSLAGCDAGPSAGPQEAHFAGARHYVAGPGASVVVDAEGLHFDAPEGGHLVVETAGAARADVHFRLSGLSEGEAFSAEAVASDGRRLARLTQHRVGGAYEVTASWPGGRPATLEALDRGHVVYTSGLDGGGGPLGTTSDVATSKHYDEKGHIVYDFEDTDSLAVGGTAYTPPDSSEGALRVTHLRVVLPEGALRDVAAVRFSTPDGSWLSVLRERFVRGAP